MLQSYTKWGKYLVVVDSGVLHHMWTDYNSFIKYNKINNSYVSLANEYKVPIAGKGAIQISLNGFTIRIHDVFHIPSLKSHLYSVKQHMGYGKCECIYRNNKAVLTFPKFTRKIHNDDDLLIFVHSIGTNINKMHWESSDYPIINDSQKTVTIVDVGDIPMKIGSVSQIKRPTSNKSPLPRPQQFFDVVHMDIAYSDITAPVRLNMYLL